MLMINQDASEVPSKILSKWSSLTGANSGGDQQELIEYVRFLTGITEKKANRTLVKTLSIAKKEDKGNYSVVFD